MPINIPCMAADSSDSVHQHPSAPGSSSFWVYLGKTSGGHARGSSDRARCCWAEWVICPLITRASRFPSITPQTLQLHKGCSWGWVSKIGFEQVVKEFTSHPSLNNKDRMDVPLLKKIFHSSGKKRSMGFRRLMLTRFEKRSPLCWGGREG